MNIDSHPFIVNVIHNSNKLLLSMLNEIKKSPDDNTKIFDSTPNAKEQYNIDILEILISISNCFGEIDNSVKLIALDLSATPNNINIKEWVEYNFSHFLVKYVSAYDLLLHLINKTFLLGNSDKNCREQIIENNQFIKNTPVGEILTTIKKHQQKYKILRNGYIHKNERSMLLKAFYSTEFANILFIYSVTKLHPETEIGENEYIYKKLADSIHNIHGELKKDLKELNKLVYDILSELFIIYNNNIQLYK